MEIERKWLVSGWPDAALGLRFIEEYEMEQGYISTRPTVRLRKEALAEGATDYVLCFKSGGGLSREEIELNLEQAVFDDLAQKILGKAMIPKLRRSYALPGGLVLEVNEVDKDRPTAFYYAEIEFESEAAALAWRAEQSEQVAQIEQTAQTGQSDAATPHAAHPTLAAYLSHEVTHEKGQSMAEYWAATRG